MNSIVILWWMTKDDITKKDIEQNIERSKKPKFTKTK